MVTGLGRNNPGGFILLMDGGFLKLGLSRTT